MIKVTLGAAETQEEKPFPKLMIRNGYESYTLIFAISQKDDNLKGVCLASNCKKDQIGEYSETWVFSVFIDYNTPITIQNA